MSANRYSQASPAKDNYFNTFVPLPLDQLTALGMSRQQDLEKNQALLDKAYNDAVDIKYNKQSPYDEANYRGIRKAFTDLAMKYGNTDLTQPTQRAGMLRELRGAVDPTLVKRMEQNAINAEQYKAMEMKLKSEGRWNEYLNDNPFYKHDSAQGVLNDVPQAYMGRKSTFGDYLDNLPVDFKGVDKGFMVHGVRNDDVNRIMNERASEIANTSGGQNEIKIYRRQHPDISKDMSNEQIINLIGRDYAQKEIHDVYSPLPEWMGSGSGKQDKVVPRSNELRVIDNTDISSFENLRDIRNKIIELKGTEEGKDLQRKLDIALKKAGLPLTETSPDKNYTLYGSMAGKPLTGGDPARDVASVAAYNEKIKQVLGEVSGTVSTKAAIGLPTYRSSNLVQMVNPATSEKLGTDDLTYIFNNLQVKPKSHEILSINDKPVPNAKKLTSILSTVNTGDLLDVSVELSPKAKYDFKPVITYSTKSKDGVVNNIRVALNDQSNIDALERSLLNRGDRAGAVAVKQTQIPYLISTANLDSKDGVNFRIAGVSADGENIEVPVTLKKKDSDGTFDVIFTDRSTNPATPKTYNANNRQEVSALIYQFIDANGSQLTPNAFVFGK
jgi:hypothetical protein